jgi:hypothetical protein
MVQIEIEKLANAFSEKFLHGHKETAKEGYLAAAKRYNNLILQLETALEVCNKERKEYRDKMDAANAEIINLQHGGQRKGAGRPKTKEPTVVMRVPKSLVAAVKKLINKV